MRNPRFLIERLNAPSKMAAWIVLAVALAITLWSWAIVTSKGERDAQVRFEFQVSELRHLLEERMHAYEQVLRGGVAMFHASGTVTRQMWQRYVESLAIERSYPGILGIGFSEQIAPQALQGHIDSVRAEGFPDYAVTPPGPRDEYTAILYLEPFSGRNLRAFGFDMFSEPVRRAAMAAARDTAAPALSGKVRLVQETDTDVQAGFLMYLPVYRDGTVPATLAERRQALVGYVFGPFRANDLLRSVLSDKLSDVELEIYDGTRATPEARLFSSRDLRTKQYENLPSFVSHSHISFNGRPWLLRVSSRPAFEASVDHAKPHLVLGAGLLVSLLFFAITWSLATTRERALSLAGRMNTALSKSEERLRRAHAELEKRVEHRTAELTQSNAQLRLRERAIESSSNAIMITDAVQPEHPIIYVNRAFERITGYAADEALGRSGHFLMGDDFGQPELESIRAALRQKREGSAILRCRHKDGAPFWNELKLAPVQDEAGQVTHFISVMTDVTERKRYEAQLEHQATHDALTGLANRVLLGDRLAQGLAHASRSGALLAVMVIDLDRFTLVNETLGHDCGDQLACLMAARLSACLRDGDTAARLGGDDFVLVLPDVAHLEEVTAIARRILREVAEPLVLAGKELFVTASVGLSISGRDGSRPEALLRSADAAMHRAKHEGGNRFSFFSQEMNSRAQEHLDLEADLRRALHRGELLLHYQPKVDLRSGQITGLEALVRWRHPEKGLVPPDRFIPLAEETGLIVPIGEWVLTTVCEQIASWRRQGVPVRPVAVNLSARQFREAGLLASVQDALQRSGIDPHLLEFEVTESMLVQDEGEAIELLEELKALGIELALDDFGTGYSSLGYLKRLPIDKLKIDRSFVRDVTNDPDDAIIAASVIALAHQMRLRVVAEGVETAAQLDYLGAHACDEIQGYYFSRPLPAQEVERLLVEGRRLEIDAPPSGERVLLLDGDEIEINAVRASLACAAGP